MLKRIVYLLLFAAFVAFVVVVLKGNKEKIESRQKPPKQLAIPVNVTTIQRQLIKDKLVMTGTSSSFKEVTVMSETQGRILSMNVEVGQKVSAGQVIAVVDEELKVAQLKTAQANLEKAQKDLERFETLLKEKAATEYQVEGAKLQVKLAEAQYIVAKRQVEDSKIKSPVSGTVIMKMLETGMMVGPASPVVTIADLSQIKVRVNVPEKDVYKLKINQTVEVSFEAIGKQKFNGKIYTIADKADEAHTFLVEILVPNPQGIIKAGMFATVDFQLPSERNAMLIPRKAIDGSLKTPTVYVAQGNKAIKKEVVLGVEKDTYVEVVNGLDESDLVIISGQNNLTENAEIEVIQK
ncbi:MAG: MexH family multidrug efflux RND transporter periplasmic adaptor subunit [Bacteroidia bacterium]|nr:MAG: MexH family multidrug efflux RND transporter periplasmic adaptor subunit [Bacteroidia bacterium]